MTQGPFTPVASDDLELACEIERDAEQVGPEATLERYLQSIRDLASMPMALDAAIEAALRTECVRHGLSLLEAAHCLARRHPDHRDALLANALGHGLTTDEDAPPQPGALVFGRWRVIESLGIGATAHVVRARDELLSAGAEQVEVVLKRFQDGIGCDARMHAFRELRALVAAPNGLAPRVIALHAPRAGAVCLVTLFEPTRRLQAPSELASAVSAVRRLHHAGVAHGDLKPEHVRVRADGSILLVDFGNAGPATPDACRRDLERLADIAGIGRQSSPMRPWIGLARFALQRRQHTVAAGFLRAGSPRWRHRVLGGALIVAGAMVALAFGWNGLRSARSAADAMSALATTGRLSEATLDGQGRIVALRLHMPELSEFAAKVRSSRLSTDSVRFRADGGVTISGLAKADLFQESLSR
jgi:hypothetical protein